MIKAGDRVVFFDPDGARWAHATCTRVWAGGEFPLIDVAHNAGDDATGRPNLYTSIPHRSAAPAAEGRVWERPTGAAGGPVQ